MQATELRRVRVRLIAGVHDAAIERGLQRNFLLKVIRTLRNLETITLGRLANADATSANNDLARNKERNERLGERRKIRLARIQVVLVAAVRLALTVHIVLVKLQRWAGIVLIQHADLLLPQLADRGRSLVEVNVTGCVLNHGVKRVGGLRRAVLRMPVVHVKTCTVGRDNIGHAHRVRVYLRNAAVAPQVKPASVLQGCFFLIVPPRASGRMQRRICHHSMCRSEQLA